MKLRGSTLGSLDQVEALRVFVRAGRARNDELIGRLSNSIASGRTGSSVFFGRNVVVETLTLFALLEYDQLTGSADPNLTLEVESGTAELLEVMNDVTSDVSYGLIVDARRNLRRQVILW